MMIGGLFVLMVLAIVAGGVFGLTWLIRRNGESTVDASGSARRIVLYALLFLLVVITAVGVAGLLGLLLPAGGAELAGSDVTELARSLAFTLIAGPIAGAFWWFLWSRIDPVERASLGWSLYLAMTTFVSTVVAGIALLSTLAGTIDGEWNGGAFATGLAWAGVWVWHRWMSTHESKSPASLTDLAPVAGSTFGLLVAAGGFTTVLASLFGTALEDSAQRLGAGAAWWETPVRALVWAAGGSAIWWWYWIHDDARNTKTPLGDTAVVLIGVVAAAAAALGGAASTLYVLLEAAFGPDRLGEINEPIGPALAAVAVGSVVWAYHARVLTERVVPTRRAARLLISGLGLAAAASGIGVIVNALLEALTQPLVATDRLGLLLGGLSALVVGAPVWFMSWRPTTPPDPDEVGSTGRRIYLVAVFGVAALTALITILVIGYQVFEFVLASGSANLLDAIRAPLGLLVASGLVAGYHYPVWKRDRKTAAAITPRSIGHVILVTGPGADHIRDLIAETTGAAVTVWQRADVSDGHPTDEHLIEALGHATGKRVMVVTGPGARLDVIPLVD